jgi:small-conductance mechanosensitive channel
MSSTSANTPPLSINLRDLANESIAWLDSHALAITLAASAGVVLYLLLRVLRRAAKRLRDRPDDGLSFANIVGRTFGRTTHFFMVMVAARLVAGFSNAPDFVLMTIRFLFTIVAVVQGAVWMREFILGLIERKSGEDGAGESLGNAMGLIRVLVTVTLFAIALIVVLDNLGVNVTGLVAGLGIGGIAIGLAAQGIFSDLFAALSIIFDKPFRIGDTVQYDQTLATVEHIGLKSTRMRALSGERKIISNANLLQKEISNFQHIEHRRVSFPIGVIYQTPPDKAAAIPALLRDSIEKNGGAFIRSGFIGFGASSLDFECIFDVHQPDMDHMAQVRHRVGLEILRRFRSEGIEFAYPTQTTFTAAPNGQMVYPYAQPVTANERPDLAP